MRQGKSKEEKKEEQNRDRMNGKAGRKCKPALECDRGVESE